MSDQTTLDNPASEPEEQQRPTELSVDDAASALSGLMEDDGTLKDDPAPKEEPKAEEKQPEAKEEQKEEEPELVEVDIDGFKVQIPKDKAEKLNSERLMQADYTRKRMADAEARKELDAEKQRTIQERQAAKQQLAAITTTLEAAVQSGQLKAPDPQLLDSDPVAYLRQQAQWTQAQQAYAQAKQQQQVIHQQEAQFEQLQRQQILEDQKAQLLAKVPEWKDEGKARAEKAEFVDWLVNKRGVPADVIENTLDHQSMLDALYRFRYEKLIAEQRAVIDKKVPPAQTRPVKPGAAQDAPTNPINKAAMDRLRRGGKVDDAASAIASLLS